MYATSLNSDEIYEHLLNFKASKNTQTKESFEFDLNLRKIGDDENKKPDHLNLSNILKAVLRQILLFETIFLNILINKSLNLTKIPYFRSRYFRIPYFNNIV